MSFHKLLMTLSIIVLGSFLCCYLGACPTGDDDDATDDDSSDDDTGDDDMGDDDTGDDACEGTTAVVDVDGNSYATVAIEEHCWMAENLAATHFPDGTPIPLVEDTATWAGHDPYAPPPAYCYYDNDSANGAIYGALYNWSAAMNGADWADADPSGVQGVCPDGWHLPSDAEFAMLANQFLGGTTQAGGALKEEGTAHWADPNVGATNSSGFTGFGGGKRRDDNGVFVGVGVYGHFYSTTTPPDGLAYNSMSVFLFNENTTLQNNADKKNNALSVRCLRD